MTAPATSPHPPNILWICTDSQRFDTLGCYGNPFVRTPHLDRMAAEGVLFEHCFAQNPLCTPSRGCMLTGRYPSCTGLRQNGQSIRASEVPVTKLLADDGWTCGLAGKLHLSACNRRFALGANWWELPPEEQVVQGTEPRIADGYSDREFFWDHAPSPHFRGSAYNRWVQARGATIATPARSDYPDLCHGMPPHLHQTFWCAETAIQFVERHRSDERPWLFSVNLFDPHYAFDPPDEYLARYLDVLDDIPLPNFVPGELADKPYYHRKQHLPELFGKAWGKAWAGRSAESPAGDPRRHRALRAAYWAMCDFIDEQVGRLLAALDASGQADRTVVIFTSDHGELLGDHGMYTKGPILYDPALRVPLIVRGPGIAEGRRVDALVELGDLAPTVLDVGRRPRYRGMQTRSLLPWLQGATTPPREDVYCEYHNANPDKPAVWLSMLRTRDWKIVRAHGGEGLDGGELYDLLEDPHETRNRWSDPACLGVRCRLLERLSDRQAFAAADPLPERTGIF